MRDEGQSLVETALLLPILLLMVCAAVDLGYFLIVAGSLSSAARVAVVYSAQGSSSASQGTLPAAGPITDNTTVSGVALGAVLTLTGTSSNTTVQVCSKSLGVTSNRAQCQSYGASSTSWTPDIDPEAPNFVLNRVDVVYTVTPPIALSYFSFTLVPSLNFHRQVSMRALD